MAMAYSNAVIPKLPIPAAHHPELLPTTANTDVTPDFTVQQMKPRVLVVAQVMNVLGIQNFRRKALPVRGLNALIINTAQVEQ